MFKRTPKGPVAAAGVCGAAPTGQLTLDLEKQLH